MDLDQTIERYHSAVDRFAQGDPEPVKALYSQHDDVTLANPFGPPVRGWASVADRLDYAASRFRDGLPIGYEKVALIVGTDVASLLEIERWEARVGGRYEITPFGLRVTSVFRRENGSWLLVHRHADPIVSADPDGPLRASPA